MASHSFSLASREADIQNVTGRDQTMVSPYDTVDRLNVREGAMLACGMLGVNDKGQWEFIDSVRLS